MFNFNDFFNNDDDNEDEKDKFQKMVPVIPPNYAVVTNDKGQIKVNKVGFSFTCLFFGVLPSLFRGDWYNFFCMIGIELIGIMGLTFVTGMPLMTSMSNLGFFFEVLWGFCYNFMYFRHLQNIGYVPIDQRSAELLKSHKYFK